MDAKSHDALDRAGEQRSRDIAELQERERNREYERGKREAEIAAHTKEQDQHLSRINGSIDHFATAMGAVEERMLTLEKAYVASTAAAAAIAEKAVSTRTFVFGVLTLLLPIIVLVLTLAVSGK